MEIDQSSFTSVLSEYFTLDTFRVFPIYGHVGSQIESDRQIPDGSFYWYWSFFSLSSWFNTYSIKLHDGIAHQYQVIVPAVKRKPSTRDEPRRPIRAAALGCKEAGSPSWSGIHVGRDSCWIGRAGTAGAYPTKNGK